MKTKKQILSKLLFTPKVLTAYIIVSKQGNPVLVNSQLPIYYLKKVAKSKASEYASQNWTVVPVELKWDSQEHIFIEEKLKVDKA